MTGNWDEGTDNVRAETLSGEASVLRQGVPQSKEIIRALLTGFRKGVAWGIFAGIVYGYLLPYFGALPHNRLEIFFKISLAGMLLGGILVTLFYFL